MSGVACIYQITFSIKCAHARVDIFHTNICLNSQNREKRRLVEVLNTTEAGNKWVTHTIDENVEESNSLCMCGEKLPPEIVYRIENTWCALSGCRFNKRYMRTPEQKADGKLEFQILMREQDAKRFEIRQQDAVNDKVERDLNKAKYQRSIIANQNKRHFHVFDLRKYPKNTENILPNLLVPVESPNYSCAICQQALSNHSDGEAVELPCKHVYHRKCIIKQFIKEKHCTMCRHDYEIFLFNGFDRTVYAHTIASIDSRREPLYIQPFKVQISGYIEDGALADMEQRAHIRLVPKEILDDKWGYYNGNSVEEEEDWFKIWHGQNFAEWRISLARYVEIFNEALGEELTAETQLENYLNNVNNVNNEIPDRDELATHMETLEEAREARRFLDTTDGGNVRSQMVLRVDPNVLDSLGYQWLIQERENRVPGLQDVVKSAEKAEENYEFLERRTSDLLSRARNGFR